MSEETKPIGRCSKFGGSLTSDHIPCPTEETKPTPRPWVVNLITGELLRETIHGDVVIAEFKLPTRKNINEENEYDQDNLFMECEDNMRLVVSAVNQFNAKHYASHTTDQPSDLESRNAAGGPGG